MNELDILKLVASRLDSAGFDYMLSGSVAFIFYGKPRMTRDIDMVVKIPLEEVDGFVSLFEADFFIQKEMVEDFGDRQNYSKMRFGDGYRGQAKLLQKTKEATGRPGNFRCIAGRPYYFKTVLGQR